MNHIEATQYIKATLAAFGPGEAISMTQDTWAKLHEAMSVLIEQPAKEKAPQSANCEAPGWISSDHARGNDCTTEQPAQQQEPVGEVYRYGKDSHGRHWYGIHWYDANVDVPTGTKLYTSPQPAQQEPVAWRWTESNGRHWFDWRTDWTHHDRAKAMGFAIEYAYTSPTAKQAVGGADGK